MASQQFFFLKAFSRISPMSYNPKLHHQAVLSLLREQAVSHIGCSCTGKIPLLLPQILQIHEGGRGHSKGKGCRKPQPVQSNGTGLFSYLLPTQVWGSSKPVSPLQIVFPLWALCRGMPGTWPYGAYSMSPGLHQQVTYRTCGLYLTCADAPQHTHRRGVWEGWKQLEALKLAYFKTELLQTWCYDSSAASARTLSLGGIKSSRRKAPERMETGSLQWCPGQEAMCTNWHTGGYLRTSGSSSLLYGLQSTGTGCPDRL